MIFPPSSLSAERRGMKEQALFRPEAAGPLIRGRWTDPSFNSWYLSILATTALFRPVKVHQKVRRFATNRPKFRVLYAYILKATPAWKKVHHRRCWRCWQISAMHALELIINSTFISVLHLKPFADQNVLVRKKRSTGQLNKISTPFLPSSLQ